MMFIAASCPSNNDAAVTIRILFFGLYGIICSIIIAWFDAAIYGFFSHKLHRLFTILIYSSFGVVNKLIFSKLHCQKSCII